MIVDFHPQWNITLFGRVLETLSLISLKQKLMGFLELENYPPKAELWMSLVAISSTLASHSDSLVHSWQCISWQEMFQ